MKPINKILLGLLIVMLMYTVVYAVEVKWSAVTSTTHATFDDMVLILDDPNGTPASYTVGRDELLMTWPGSANITTLGTIATGVWQGTAIADAYIPNNITIDLATTATTANAGDSATAFFSAGTIEHEYGGLEANVSAYDGFVYITGGATSAKTQHAGTDVTADLEEETHASEHAVSGGDTIFPADPGADRALLWDDDPGALVWYDISGLGTGDMLKATYDAGDDGGVDAVTTSDTVTSTWVLLSETQVGTDGVNTDGALTYDAATGTLAATVFSGAGTSLTGVLLTAGTDNVKDTHIDWGAGATQVDLADIPGGTAGASAFDFGGATSLEIPNAESADATLTALGQVHVRGDEDRYSIHFGAGGEIAGEATMSALKRLCVTLDPGAWYDSSAYVNLGPILAKQWPNGILIDYWQATCHLDPDVEMDLDLCYSVNDFDLADPNLVDVLDTTAGRSSEDTDANINAGAAIPAGVYLYLRFGADPEGTCVMLTVTILYHGKED